MKKPAKNEQLPISAGKHRTLGKYYQTFGVVQAVKATKLKAVFGEVLLAQNFSDVLFEHPVQVVR